MNQPKSHPRMSVIPVRDAVGSVLCHDITVIAPGDRKDRAFKKGHVVREEDIPVLLDLGKEHLYAFAPEDGFLHEEDAALRLATASRGDNLDLSDVKEGRINFIAGRDGLLRINVPLLDRINGLGDITFATLHSHRPVAAGDRVAGVRVVPLMVDADIVREAERLCQADPEPIVSVLAFKPARVGVVITGSEIYHGRITDKFAPVLREKFAALGSTVIGEVMTADEVEWTKGAIHHFMDDGADMVVLTGGMSVDPDDLTPTAIRASGAEVVTYGAPVFPGAMFLLSHLERGGRRIPVLGLPGCVMYHRASIFDLVVPRLLAGLEVTRADIVRLGHGGFCSTCADCRFPNCGFGC
ncbi:MAG: molybdopterin-binding protein [Planctomycetes bacterium]|nr:molybdopterin-binding protein [Planctomycetota bacterium]